MPHTYAQAIGTVENAHGSEHLVVVVERFAQPHEDDVGNPLALRSQILLYSSDLLHDFPGGEMAFETHDSRSTKVAAHGAADLRRDANGHTAGSHFVGVAHLDTFHFAPLREIEEVLLGVLAFALGHSSQLESRHDSTLCQFGAQLLREIGHLFEIVDPSIVDPLQDLLGSILWLADLEEELFHFRVR